MEMYSLCIYFLRVNDVGSTKVYKGVNSRSYVENRVYLGNLKDHHDSEEERYGKSRKGFGKSAEVQQYLFGI